MCKNSKRDDQEKTVMASTVDEMLEKVEMVDAYCQWELGWIQEFSRIAGAAEVGHSQIVSDLNEIANRLKKKKRKDARKGTVERLSPKVQAKLDRTLDRVITLTARCRKRNSGDRSYSTYVDEFGDVSEESELLRDNIDSITRALKRS